MVKALGFPPLNRMCWSHFLLVKTVWFVCCRNEFHKLGRDLENAKGKDMEKYHSILGKLRESYRQCGTSHKRLKKIFIVLHEELQHLKQMIKDCIVSNTRNCCLFSL
ncbi:uncharacterized protein LOC131322867 [Rhododendron vialii]|uniref:uncharacterized protein LOC131322867 n=1 Tax=Rhododendron vialii TaxID=182163 RepID=UPI00265EC83F|nr:uncharacterized protein LOC131322867 [Rhododendron vialii]